MREFLVRELEDREIIISQNSQTQYPELEGPIKVLALQRHPTNPTLWLRAFPNAPEALAALRPDHSLRNELVGGRESLRNN